MGVSMDKKSTFSFIRYPWQKYALAIGAIVASAIILYEVRIFQFHSTMKEMHHSWEDYQNKMLFLFVFYSVILLNLIGQLLIAKIGKTEKRAYTILFILMLVSTLAIAIAGYLLIASSSQQILRIFWLLLLALLVIGTLSVGIRIIRLPSNK